MKKLFFAAALGAAIVSPAYPADFANVLNDKSTVAFTSKQMGVPVDGDFKRFKAGISFDPAKPQAAQASIELDVASIDAGSKDANDEVVGKNWFNVKQFPTANFKSSAVKPLGGNRFELRGPLTIKGKTHEVVTPVSFRQDGANGVFDGSFTLKRLDYGLGEGQWADTETVANEVQIKFHIVAAPKK